MRITTNEVVRSYGDELHPTNGAYCRTYLNKVKVCGLTATILRRLDKTPQWAVDSANDLTMKEISAILKVSEEYVEGFIHGWDCLYVKDRIETREYGMGVHDGLAALGAASAIKGVDGHILQTASLLDLKRKTVFTEAYTNAKAWIND